MLSKAINQLIGTITCAGRVICAWCNADMGPAKTSQDTHSICSDCAKKV